MADYTGNQQAAHPSGKSSPQGYYGPPVPAQFISTNQQDGMQPLALVKRVTGPPPSTGNSATSTPGQNIPSQPPALRVADPAMNPTVIVTTRTPIFIKSSSHVSPIPRQAVMAHTQSTQSIAAVRPSLVMNQMPPALVRIPDGSPRLTQLRPNPTHGRPNLTQVRPGLTQLRPGTPQVRPGLTPVRPGMTQIRPGLQLRHIYPSPRIPLQRGPPPTSHLQPLRTPPPHRSPKLQQLTPPVAHMVNRKPPMSVQTSRSPFPAHTRKIPGQRIRSPPSTQQVRPMIINTSGSMIRPVLSIPGTPHRIQATLGAISTQVTLKSPKGQMVIAQSSKSSVGSPATQLSQSNTRSVILPRQLLPANFKNQPYQVGKKVLVAVNPHGMKQSQAVKIQAKPVSPMPATSSIGGNMASLVAASPSQILVPLHTSPSRKLPYTGKKRGRKKGSKNKPKVGQGIKIRILPTTAVHGVPHKPPASKEGIQPDRGPEPEPVPPPVKQENTVSAPTEDVAPPILPVEQSRPKPLEENRDETPAAAEIPRAVVKPTILTHVIDGFIIEESKEPFPMPENNSMQLAVNADGSRTTEEPRGLKREAQDSWEPFPGYLRCEFCGKTDFPRKFKRSKRFCSMACAKRYNVGCTKRLGLFSPKEEKPTRVKHKMKLQGPKAKPLKGARGKYGRLKFNVTQPWNPKTKIVFKAVSGAEGPPSEESCSTSSSNATVSPLISELDSIPFPEEVEDLPSGLPGNPGSWSVANVRDFIRSVPGCHDFAEEFHSQEIDGQALMLLKEDHLMTTMNMKLGPALKIISKINTLREKPVVL